MQKNKLFVLLLLGSLYPGLTFCQTLNFSDFLRNVSIYHPRAIRGENLRNYGSAQLSAAQGNFDPQINGSYDNKYYKGIEYYSYAESEIKQQIFTNQYLKAGYEYGNGAFLNPERTTSSFGLPFAGIEVGLLQGMMMDKNRAEVLKSRAYVDYYQAERNSILNKLYLEASQSYFEWVFQVKKRSLTNYFLNLADQRLKGIEALAVIGERAAMDTLEAAIFLQSRQLDYQSSLIDIQKSINELSTFNWNGEQPSPVLTEYFPGDSLENYYERVKINLGRLIADTTDNPAINKVTSLQKVLDVEVRLRKEYIKPKLNVNYNFLSADETFFSNSFTTNNYKWGVNLALPLYLRKPRNEFKMAKINSRNNALEISGLKNELYYKTQATIVSIQMLTEQINNAERSARYSRNLVEAERLKFNNGESSLFLLNTRESKWLDSELKLAEYKLKFIQTYFYLTYLKGTLAFEL